MARTKREQEPKDAVSAEGRTGDSIRIERLPDPEGRDNHLLRIEARHNGAVVVRHVVPTELLTMTLARAWTDGASPGATPRSWDAETMAGLKAAAKNKPHMIAKGRTLRAEGNNGGDYVEIIAQPNGRLYVEVGHCCVVHNEVVVPVEYLTATLAGQWANGPENYDLEWFDEDGDFTARLRSRIAPVAAPAEKVDTMPLLRMLKEQRHVEMLSRTYLHDHGIGEKVIVEADRRGEVVIGEGGSFASVLLTVDGDAALERHDAASGPRP